MDPRTEISWLLLGILSLPAITMTIAIAPKWKNLAQIYWVLVQKMLCDLARSRTDEDRENLAKYHGKIILSVSFKFAIVSLAILIPMSIPWLGIGVSNKEGIIWVSIMSLALLRGLSAKGI